MLASIKIGKQVPRNNFNISDTAVGSNHIKQNQRNKNKVANDASGFTQKKNVFVGRFQ